MGQLPAVRSDASAVTAGSSAYLIGGYDGSSWNPDVLATQDGQHFGWPPGWPSQSGTRRWR